MNKEEYEKFCAMDDWMLVGLAGDHDYSPRKAAMLHILEMRRIQKAALSAERSAVAARWSAVAAFLSVLVAIVALYRMP